MSKRCLCSCYFLILVLIPSKHPAEHTQNPMPGTRLQWFADRGLEKGEKVVYIDQGGYVPPDARVDLESALGGYDVVLAKLLQEETDVGPDAIFRWYKFRIDVTLYKAPQHLDFSSVQPYPRPFGQLTSDEFAFRQDGGTTVVSGVTLRDIDGSDEVLLPGKTYMAFVNREQDGIATIPGELIGLYRISGDRLIAQYREESHLRDDISSLCHNSLADCRELLLSGKWRVGGRKR